ncbi:MAG: hypothetical protein QM666_05030 [Acinetobacter sp.]
MAFFGFIPSAALLEKIQFTVQKRNFNDALYVLRDEIALKVNEELLDAILTDLIHQLPDSDKKDTAEKLANFIKSSVAVLLKQLMGKADPKIVKNSLLFLEKSLFTDPQGQLRMGTTLDESLVTNLKFHYQHIIAGEKINVATLAENYKIFAESIVRHYLHDFNETLELGMIKRKASDLGCNAVIKAVHIAIDKIFPRLNKDELKILAKYHDSLFFHSN